MLDVFFDWDDENDPNGNVQHIAEHGVTVEEFEEVALKPDAADIQSRSTGRPGRIGWTSSGKYLVVVFEVEEDADLGIRIIRPVTGYEITPP